MALHNPNNLYSGGAVIFDSRPFTQFYLQSMARKRAREDAIDNYYRDLGKSLTPTGMAANDVNDFVAKKNQWQQDAIQNRRVLSNPKDPAYAEAISRNNYLYNDALEHAETSKTKVKDLYQAKTLIKPDHPFTDGSVASLHEADLPITQGYKPLDFSTLQYDEKPFEIADQQKYYKNALTGINLGSFVDKIDVDSKTHGKTVTTSFKYEPQALEALRMRAAIDLQGSTKLQNFVHSNMNNEFGYNALNPAFKEAYKRDISTDEDFLAASLLTHAKTEYTQQREQGYNPFAGMSLWGANASNTGIQDIYTPIKMLSDNKQSKGTYLQINEIDPSAQKVILDYANSIAKAKDIYGKNEDLTQENTLIKNDSNGIPTLYVILQKGTKDDYSRSKGIRAILPLNSFDINSKINTTAKQKQVLIQQEVTEPKPKTTKKKKYNPATGQFE